MSPHSSGYVLCDATGCLFWNISARAAALLDLVLAAANRLNLVKQTNFILQVGSYLKHRVYPFAGIIK